jgi:predicted CXXCH cytochrome family protein
MFAFPSSRNLLLVVPLAATLASCTTESIVYRDREPFNEPVAAAAGFLGYYNEDTKRTTCGNCHVGHQSDWVGTAHADAMAVLPASAGASCKSCHSVNAKGNIATGVVGFDATQDTIYEDVQCEACHGPGLEHVRNPEVPANVPYANANLTDPEASCASCHTGTHHPFVEQWELSRHSNIRTGSPTTSTTCMGCHEGKTALLRLSGQDPNFRDKAEPAGAWPITCTVCHDPHANRNTGQLRMSASNNDPAQNLCMSCHMRNIEPVGGNARGNAPHAPQGAVLVGIAGYRPPGFAQPEDQIVSTHGSSANPRLCAGCHVNKFTVNDPEGGFVFQAVGHTFGALPCVDAQGVPTGNSGCDYNSTARTFVGCTSSGCHSTAQVASNALSSLRQQVALFADILWVDTDDDESIDAAPTDAGLLPEIKRDYPGAINSNDAIISPADGAEFNVKLFGEHRYGNGDKSLGVHNPFLAKGLLAANIAELQATYPGIGAIGLREQAAVEGAMQAARFRLTGTRMSNHLALPR